MAYGNYPRIVIAGLSGDSGKTVVSCGLISSLVEKGLGVSAFKKGPDYIDAAWLSLASGKPARNLDTYLMGFSVAKESFLKNASRDGVNIIEGNRGLFDGVDIKGTHSTAELSKLLRTPVVIVQDVSKVTRTAAAEILGCVKLDPEVDIAGVILNRVANGRHARVVKESIEAATGIPVLGAIPRLSRSSILPSRHLGLITPAEYQRRLFFLGEAKRIVEESVDISRIVQIAQKAKPLDHDSTSDDQCAAPERSKDGDKVTIAYFKDESFSFYYPENLEKLDAAGAKLVPVSPARGTLSNDLDALYIGGGFPEMNLTSLIMNKDMITSVKEAAEAGLPIYAECGGLMYLAEKVELNGDEYPLSGVLPISVRMHDRPQGHGYCEAVVDNGNPFFGFGTVIKGHEFHYSKITDHNRHMKTALSISRGSGSFDGRDGLTYKNVFASYVHIHAASCPEWVSGMIGCAKRNRYSRKNANLREYREEYHLRPSSL